jgi:hypothetical protein
MAVGARGPRTHRHTQTPLPVRRAAARNKQIAFRVKIREKQRKEGEQIL